MIVNFPGSPKACAECFAILTPVLHHCVDQLRGDVESVDNSHNKIHQNNVNHTPSPSSVNSHRNQEEGRSSRNSVKEVMDLSPKLPSAAPASRPRQSLFPMIETDEALSIILSEMSNISSSASTELVPIHDLKHLMHRILAVDLKSNVNIPPFPASVKDGYAVLTIDGGGNTRKVLPAPSTAGTVPSSRLQVTSGYCVRISTGAPVPVGADAVVQVEDTELTESTDSGEEREIFIKVKPSFGQDIRSVGSDVKKGEIVLKEGTVLTPVDLSIISSVGFADVPVLRLPVVGILSTGDEIIPAGSSSTPSSGKIWDANKTCLAGLLSSKNIDYIDLGIAKDDPDEVYNKLVTAFDSKEVDVLITTGGVSMGERDVLKNILEVGFEGKIHFARVNIKPGKPMTFITCDWKGNKKVIFALPGNPVSAFVTCYLFVIPSLLSLSHASSSSDLRSKERKKRVHARGTEGHPIPSSRSRDKIQGNSSASLLTSIHRTMSAVLRTNGKVINLDSRPEFCRGILSFDNQSAPEVELIQGSQASSRLLSVRDANVLVMLPQRRHEKTQVFDGDVVSVILID